MIGLEDKELLKYCLDTALEYGADKARVTLNRSIEDLVATLNAEVDRITHCGDNSLSLALFADGRYGTFSTNKMDRESIREFIAESISIVKAISPDECRVLPPPELCCTKAVTGDELDLCDSSWETTRPEDLINAALKACIFNEALPEEAPYSVISEEGEYSGSIYETLLMDTNGVCCLHRETSFDYGVEVTIECGGDRYSGYWWDSSSRKSKVNPYLCGRKALEKAIAQIGSEAVESGSYTMVIDSEVASKMVSPILRALNGFAIQQNNSFLMDSLGTKLFPESMTIMDCPHIKGRTCSKLFDSEGVATTEHAIIEKGVIKEYFINSYMSRKLGMPQTTEDATSPKLMPTIPGAGRDSIMKMCGSGILVTDFNGGNSNSVTGDFSYGIEGFLFKDGVAVRPVSEMLVTGNFLKLWDGFIASGDDARDCMSKLIPTLAFANVDFSGN